jgi:hypothetical protein
MLQLEDVIASCNAVLTASVLPRLVPTVVALAEIGRLTHTPASVEALQVNVFVNELRLGFSNTTRNPECKRK